MDDCGGFLSQPGRKDYLVCSMEAFALMAAANDYSAESCLFGTETTEPPPEPTPEATPVPTEPCTHAPTPGPTPPPTPAPSSPAPTVAPTPVPTFEPIHCEVGTWTSWTVCDEPCGGGVTRRTRNLTEPAYGGDPCPTDPGTVEVHECNVEACPVDCKLGEWSPFTACTAS